MKPAFRLRPWADTDLDSLLKYANNFKVARYLTDQFPHPYTEADGRAFLARVTPLMRAIEYEGEAVGGIGLHPQADLHRRNAEIGYWLAEPFWGQGLMSRAVAETVAFGFLMPDIDRIFASVIAENTASQRVLEKAGFVREVVFKGTLYKNGQRHDEHIFAIRRPV